MKKTKKKNSKEWILTQLLVRYIGEAFAKRYILYPFVATTMDQRMEEGKKCEKDKNTSHKNVRTIKISI